MCNQQVLCPHPWLIWHTISGTVWHKNEELLQATAMISWQFPDLSTFMNQIHRPVQRPVWEGEFLTSWIKMVLKKKMHFINCVWKHSWTFQLWKFPFMGDISAHYHINHQFLRNCEWLMNQCFYSIQTWLSMVNFCPAFHAFYKKISTEGNV